MEDSKGEGSTSTSKVEESKVEGSTFKLEDKKVEGSTSKLEDKKVEGSTSKLEESKVEGSTSKFEFIKVEGSTSKLEESKVEGSTSKLEESKVEGSTSKLEESKVEGSTSKLEESKVEGSTSKLEESKVEGSTFKLEYSKLMARSTFKVWDGRRIIPDRRSSTEFSTCFARGDPDQERPPFLVKEKPLTPSPPPCPMSDTEGEYPKPPKLDVHLSQYHQSPINLSNSRSFRPLKRPNGGSTKVGLISPPPNIPPREDPKALLKYEPKINNLLPSPQNEAQDLSIHTNLTNTEPEKEDRRLRDFMDFCEVILDYTQYPSAFITKKETKVAVKPKKLKMSPKAEQMETTEVMEKVDSPLNSIGESGQGTSESSVGSPMSPQNGETTNNNEDANEDHDQITCFCGKPYSGRSMIQCEDCLIWLHFPCARVRRNKVPENYYCSRCRPYRQKRKYSTTTTTVAESSESAASSAKGISKGKSRPSLSEDTSSSVSTTAPSTSATSVKSPPSSPTEFKRPPEIPPNHRNGNVNGGPAKVTPTVKSSQLYKKAKKRQGSGPPTGNGIMEDPMLPLCFTLKSCDSIPL